MLLILISVALVAGIWAVVNSFVNERLDSTSSCFNLVGKVKLNNDWTCYNATSNEMQISIGIGDVDVKGVLVAVVFSESSTVFTVNNDSSLVENVSYLGTPAGEVSLPNKEGTKTYVLENVIETPDEIQIAAISDKKQCDISDVIDSIFPCS